MEQVIETADFLKWHNDEKVGYASSFGNGVDKKIGADLKGNFFVINKGILAYSGHQAEVAVEIYNNIQS